MYVGVADVPSERLAEHVRDVRGEDRKSQWIAELRALGMKPTMEIIDRCAATRALEREAHWIERFNPPMNIQRGTDPVDTTGSRFAEWISRVGPAAVARSLDVSRQAVESWRRYACGGSRSKNSYPPSIDLAAKICVLSDLTIADFIPSSATESAPHGRKATSR